MRHQTILLLAVCSLIFVPKSAPIRNEYEVSVEIVIEIPDEDKTEDQVKGLTEKFFKDLAEHFPIAQPVFKMCVAVIFPINKDDKYPSACAFAYNDKSKSMGIIFDHANKCVNQSVNNRMTGTTKRMRLEENQPRFPAWESCTKNSGAPKISIFVRKIANDWDQKVKEDLDRLMGSNDEIDLFIAVSDFGTSTIVSFDMGIYNRSKSSIMKGPQTITKANFGQISDMLANHTWTAVQSPLHSCEYTTTSGCFYFEREKCGLRTDRHGENSTQSKYCVYGPKFAEKPECPTSKCDEICEQNSVLTQCDVTCGLNGRRRKVAKWENGDSGEKSKELAFCPFVVEQIYVDCPVEKCPNIPENRPGGIAMITIGVLILVALIVAALAAYYFIWRPRKMPTSTNPEKNAAMVAAAPKSVVEVKGGSIKDTMPMVEKSTKGPMEKENSSKKSSDLPAAVP